jgi:signal transduction histidine kinase
MADWGISKLTVRPTLAVVLRYGLAVLLVAIALAIAAITHLHHSPPRFVSHFVLLAIAITFWCAGTGPGLLALLLSCLGVGLLARKDFLTPDFPLVQFLIFFVVFSLLMSLFSTSRRRAQKQLVEARDTLELRVAERTDELQRSEAYLAEAQRLSQTGSWAWNPSSGNTHLSEECYRLLGFDPHGPPPRLETVIQRIHPDDQTRCRQLVEKVIRDKVDFDVDSRIVHRDKRVRDIHCVGHAVLDRSGDLVELVGTVIDITERKRADEEREKLHQLEADLAHVNRVSMMGELAASLAHEIKQPIAAAVSNAEACLHWIARDQPDLVEAHEAATETVNEARRAADIITRIRSLFQKEQPRREPLDINEVISEMVSIVREEARRHAISLRTLLCSNLPRVSADRVQLEQVLMNLMLNGIEAMREMTGELTIKTQRDEHGHVLISVSDIGVGLPAENVAKIFDAFFSTKAQGTGMGLAISRSIIESHGGRIWATANAGRGTTFHCMLPNEIGASA